MDFSILHNNSIRIRTKRASFVVDPVKQIAKVNSDAVILLDRKEDTDLSRVSDYRVVIGGAGEYEVKSVKISGTKVESGFVYSIFADNLNLVLAKVSALSGIQDKSWSCQIAILNSDEKLGSIAAKLEPAIMLLYGEKKTDGAKELGKENIKAVEKFSIVKDKLPTEMELVAMG